MGVLVQEMRKKPMRPHLCDAKARRALISQMVETIRERLGEREVRSFAEICELIPLLELKLRKSQLGGLSELQTHETIDYKLYLQGYHKFCYHHWKPQDQRTVALNGFKGNNSGLLLWGEKGCGKS